DRLDGAVDTGMAGHQRDLRSGVGAPDRADDLETADFGHVQVDEYEIRFALVGDRDGLLAARTGDHFEGLGLGHAAHHREDGGLIVGDQQQWTFGRGRRCHGAAVYYWLARVRRPVPAPLRPAP